MREFLKNERGYSSPLFSLVAMILTMLCMLTLYLISPSVFEFEEYGAVGEAIANLPLVVQILISPLIIAVVTIVLILPIVCSLLLYFAGEQVWEKIKERRSAS